MEQEDTKIYPAFKEKNIPVVFNADNNYVNYLKVMLHSLIKNTSNENNYDLIFFNKDISEDNKKSFLEMIKEYKNISLRFIDINPMIKDLKLKVTKRYPVEIYFRLFMPYILEEYDKAIYLDGDLVLCEDVANLAKYNIGNNLLGAIRDINMLVHYYYYTGKVYIPRRYFDNALKEVNPNEYFNSGVLIFNLEEFRKTYTLEDVFKLVQREDWFFPDQDVLNILCVDKVKLLPRKMECCSTKFWK